MASTGRYLCRQARCLAALPAPTRSITRLGEAETYNITLPGFENFIANDTLSHNTGTLEAYVVRSVMQKTSNELEEYLFHTPAQADLQPVYDRISSKITNTSVFAAMLSGMSETKGVMEFANACKWWFRIEGGSGTGRNKIGIRASRLVGDEGAYSNEAAHRERQLTKTPDCDELWCGVPNGVRGTPFYRADQTIEGKLQGWSRHNLSTLDNPLFWSEKARPDPRAGLRWSFRGWPCREHQLRRPDP